MSSPPTGNITFLFTDIEGSTKLSQEFPDTLPLALEKHHTILKEAIESNNGFVFEIIGDAFCAAFENADDAVKAAYKAQLNLSKEKWNDAVIKVRMGIHSGKAEWNGQRYMGYITLARTSRVMSAAYGEQILISNDAYELTNEMNEISFRDLGERRLKDVIQPIRLFQIVSPKLREDFPPLKTLDARPNNLPVQLTSFIGREEEMKQVKNLLRQTHLLTLTGSGGAGKTRLALQVAADIIDDFANGVWFVELASLSDPILLIQSVMSALGVLEEPKSKPEDTLTGFLKDKEILIILDNCEHLINACAGLAENLLLSCPKLKTLATSREALKSSGEQIYRIPTLSQPDPEANDTPEQLTQYESVRLFIERALTVDTKFRVTNENAPALAEICSRLDGIPLAIELAAARTTILTVEKIYERLDDRFNLLTGGKRTSLPRQQTLRSLIDWSYDLLPENEKILWNRLSVFRGGWTLESAEEICSDVKINKYEIIELLQNLSEKSIIIFDNVNERYQMLETIRQYGDEKLRNSEEYKNISKTHLKYYTELAETADLKLQGPEIVKWLKVLDKEKGNMDKGLMFSDESVDTEAETRLAGALGKYWEIRGQYTEGILRFGKIYLKIPETMNSSFSKIVFLIGTFTLKKGEIEKAKKFLSESHEHYIKLNKKSGIGSALNCLGDILRDQGEFDKAIVYYKESLEIDRGIGNKSGIAISLSGLGNVFTVKGEYDKAIVYHKESLAIRREIGNKRGIANSLNNLGSVYFNYGDYDITRGLFEESLAIRREIGDKIGIATSHNNLGNISRAKGEFDKAIIYFKESLAILSDIGYKGGFADCLYNLGCVYSNTGEYGKALVYYEQSLVIKRELGEKIGIANSLDGLGCFHSDKAEYDKAIFYFQKELTIRRDIGDREGIAQSLNNQGIISYNKGEYQNATDFSEESLAISREIGNKRGIATSLINLGNVYFHKEEYDKATDFYEEGLAVNRDIGDKGGIGRCLNNLGTVFTDKREYDKATGLHEESLEISCEIGNKEGIADSLKHLGDVFNCESKYDKAREYYKNSLSQFMVLGRKRDIAISLLRLIELHLKAKSDIPLTKLLGFLNDYSESNKFNFPRSEQKVFDESILKLKENIREEEFLKSFEDGRSMKLEEAVDLILNYKS